jgi:hypothetical protein
MKIKSLYEMFKKVRPYLLVIAFTLFVFSWVMKYGAPGGYEEVVFWTSVSRYLAIFIIVVGQPIDFKKNVIMIVLWMFYNVYEFILVLSGIHVNHVNQISTYLLDMGLYVLMAISLATYLSKKINLVWAAVQLGLTLSLGWMAFNFHSQLMTYIPDLVSGIYENSRISRVGIGFYNVNILGGLSGLLVFVSLIGVCKKQFRYSSVITTFFGAYLLINAGTRSAMLSLVATLLFFLIVRIGRRFRTIIVTGLPIAFFVGEFIYGTFIGVVNGKSNLAEIVGSLTTKRSELGMLAFDRLSDVPHVLFGTGMRIQADIRATFFSDWLGSYGLDGEPQWFIFTTGIFGALVTLIIVSLAMYRIGKRSVSGFLFMVYFGTTMTFEHVFFNSQSASGSFGLILMVLFVILLGDGQSDLFRRQVA